MNEGTREHRRGLRKMDSLNFRKDADVPMKRQRGAFLSQCKIDIVRMGSGDNINFWIYLSISKYI